MTKDSTAQTGDSQAGKPSLIVRHLAAIAGVPVEKVTPEFIEQMVKEAHEAADRDAAEHGLQLITSEELRQLRNAPIPRLS